MFDWEIVVLVFTSCRCGQTHKREMQKFLGGLCAIYHTKVGQCHNQYCLLAFANIAPVLSPHYRHHHPLTPLPASPPPYPTTGIAALV